MFDFATAKWYVSEPRSVFAQVGDEPDLDKDKFVCIADDNERASHIVDVHNKSLKKK